MALRITIADEILEDGLDVMYEIMGGHVADRDTIIAETERVYAASFKVTQDRDTVWRAQGVLRDVAPLYKHPVYAALLDQRGVAERSLMVVEAGMCILRIDYADEEPIQAAMDLFRESLIDAGKEGMVRCHDLGRSLEDWRPLEHVSR